MDGAQIVAIVLAAIGLLGTGGLGKTLLDRWSERDRLRAAADGSVQQVQFTDNEQARKWLREQLNDAEQELKAVRENERALLTRVGDLAAQVARMEARTDAQAARIDDLSATVARLGADYAEMKAERDRYRDEKHAAENRLTAESLGRQLAEKDKAALSQEVERLRSIIETKEGT